MGGLFDSFSRPNSTGLGNADTGQAWTPVANRFDISSNKAVAGANGALNVAALPATSADVYMRVDVIVGSGTGGGLAARVTSPGSWIELQYLKSSNTLRLMRITNLSGFVNLASTGVTLTTGSTATLELWASGSNYTGRVNGGSQITATDTQNQSVASHGIYAEDTSFGFQNFTVSPAVS